MLIPSVLGFATGVLIHSFNSVSFLIIIGALSVGAFGLVFVIFQKHSSIAFTARTYTLSKVIFVFIALCAGGVLRYHIFVEGQGDQFLRTFVDQNIVARGVVVDEPQERAYSTRLIVSLYSFQNKNIWHHIRPTKIIISVDPFSDRVYGDDVELTGVLSLPQNFETDNGRVFDYVSYLKKDRVFYEMKQSKPTFLGAHRGSKIKEWLFTIKKTYTRNLDAVISYPESRLAAGLTVAGKAALPEETLESFHKTGTLQLVVLSGYNMTLVAQGLLTLTQTLPAYLSSFSAIVGILLFTIMAGGSATVIRGSIMVIAVLLAKIFRRQSDSGRILLLTAFLMCLWNPMYLVFDPSFQLSFLATAGLIYVSPLLEKRLSFISERLMLRQAVATTLATQLFVLPFLIYMTGEVSLVSVPANLALFLFIPITMLGCFATGVIGFFSTLLSFVPGFISFILLRIELHIISLFSRFPFASVTVHSFPLWCVVLVYMCYIVFMMRFYKKEARHSTLEEHA